MNLKELKISDKKIAILQQMKINSVMDLLMHYPFRYEENIVKSFEEWEKGDKVCFEATIISAAHVSRYAYKKSMTRFKVLYEHIELDITLFNRPWVSAFQIGKKMSIFGKYDGNYRVTCMNYNSEPLDTQLGMIPVYNVKEGISQKEIHKYIQKGLSLCTILDFIPQEYRHKYRLISKVDALKQIHSPTDKEGLKQSLRTLKYEEFLKFQLQMQYMKQMNTTMSGLAKVFDEQAIAHFIKRLPYALTNGQKGAVDDILHDLQSERVMYRLVQGDVGCGKTLVAAIGMYACVCAKKQVAMLAPTEILAKQHYQNLCTLFALEDIKIAMLYASMKSSEKKSVLTQIADGSIDMIVGTHALFQEDVKYANLGMVVADEQHRFGVEQRRKLLEKGDKVDFLLMSATPIPRTLAVSLYGDMEVSTIDTMPKGKKEIQTIYVKEDSLKSVLMDILQMIDEGIQCYIVAPAIEKNDEYSMRNVEQLYASMNQVLGKKYRIGLLHGKMSSEEKDETMQRFLNHQYDILITTTVIEVGVDVKNANIMVIYDAHRFGMSQIHQLRGRVGRGKLQGYCYLVSGTKEEQAQKRLQLLADTSDGFMIAQADLHLRGAGDLLGVRQSGISGFILGDIINDHAILEVAKQDAIEILSKITQYPLVKTFVLKKDYTSYLD
ncbi:MAG: ATP-dependent DNA helicase RecG [Erysipelotrichia bacterium]|nr:ATP-dependent DNA helicase RecG [Erysipelotrichia bacterium]